MAQLHFKVINGTEVRSLCEHVTKRLTEHKGQVTCQKCEWLLDNPGIPYQRGWQHRPIEARREGFWKRVDKSGECWLWTGPLHEGYGSICFNGKKYGVHTFVMMLEGKGPRPGELVRHLCHTTNCVRPDHLARGTQADNVADRQAADRGAKGSKNGRAKLNEEKVKLIRQIWALNKLTKRQIAKLLDTSFSAVSDIVRGKIWRHVL